MRSRIHTEYIMQTHNITYTQVVNNGGVHSTKTVEGTVSLYPGMG